MPEAEAREAGEARAKLSLAGVKKRFGDNEVLRGIDLDIAKGEMICLIGPSGSGK